MKLPKLPAQWVALDDLSQKRVDEASELVVEFLYQAGHSSPQDLDENGDEIGDEVQSLLMDAVLRDPHLYLHVSKLVELTRTPPTPPVGPVDYQARWMNLPKHQRDYGDAVWQGAFGKFSKPVTRLEWEVLYRSSSAMDGTMIQKYHRGEFK
jgi:hypothetical protein